MSQRATLTAHDAPQYGPGWRRLVLDCPHGTTEGAYRNSENPEALQLSDAGVVKALLVRHYDAERCRCTLELRRRHGLVKVWP